MDIVGIAPTSIALQAIANLPQLNVQINGTERTRTVIFFIDSEVPHLSTTAPKRFWILDFGFQIDGLAKISIKNRQSKI